MKLLREGRSFSGHERNCVFLNCRSPRFANVSAITGLDFPDDGRALAAVDWDHDGDLDLWFHNRTGPRLRFMRNQTISQREPDNEHFLALRLQGTASNRDAIGARVEVVLKDENSELEVQSSEIATRDSPPATRHFPLIQTLYAGDAYLSQSSKSLHFGIGGRAEIKSVLVRWPHGEVEQFTDMRADRRYLLVEGSGTARESGEPRQTMKLTAATQMSHQSSPAARTILSHRLPMPIMQSATLEGADPQTIELGGRPRLISFWASWCNSCVAELQEFAEHEQQLRRDGLDILALSVDGLDLDHPTQTTDADRILKKLNFPFQAGVATREMLDKLEVVQRIVLNRQSPFAVPTSLLLDSAGHLAAIYRGPVAIDVLRADIGHLASSRDERRDLAVPFPGRWNSEPRNLLLRPVADVFKQHGHLEDYERYLEMEIELKDKARQSASSDEERKQIDEQYAVMHFNLARTLHAEGQTRQAIDHYRQGLDAKPDDALAHYFLGRALSSNQEVKAAIEQLQHALQIDPQITAAHIHLGKILRSQGQTDKAIDHYRQALADKPDSVEAHFHLGVALAKRDERDAAIDHFQQAVTIQPDHVEARINLGAIFASQHQWDTAIQHLRQAVQLRPDNVQAGMNLGGALGSKGDFAGAADEFRRIVAIRPNVAQAQARLAHALLELGDAAQAAVHFETAIEQNPADGSSMLRLAWLWATNPADEVRNGVRAVELAERLNKASGEKDPTVLDVLAAAFAERGDFDAAARAAGQALEHVGPDQEAQSDAIRQRLERYQQGLPYRDVRRDRP